MIAEFVYFSGSIPARTKTDNHEIHEIHEINGTTATVQVRAAAFPNQTPRDWAVSKSSRTFAALRPSRGSSSARPKSSDRNEPGHCPASKAGSRPAIAGDNLLSKLPTLPPFRAGCYKSLLRSSATFSPWVDRQGSNTLPSIDR